MSAHPEAVRPGEARGAARMARIFASLVSADFVTRVLAAVATVLVVRTLAPDQFGEIAYALAAGAVIATLVDLGLTLLLMRDVSEDAARAPSLLGAVLQIQAVLGAAVFGIAALAGLLDLFPGPAGPAAIALAMGVMAVNGLIRPYQATLAGLGRAHLVTIAYSVRGLALIALTVLAAVAEPTVAGFLGAALAAELVGFVVVAWLSAARSCRPQLSARGRELWELARRALPFALLAGFGLVYLRIDTIMLGLLGSDAQVGNYGVAVRVLETAIAVPAYFGNAFLATVSQIGATSPAVPARTVRALRYLLLICVPLTFLMAVTADPLVRLVAGGDYDDAGELLARTSPVLALMAAYAVLANLQIALDRIGTLVRISVAGVVFKIVLGAWAIPRYGANGAALAAVAGELVVVVAQWYSTRDQFDVGAALGWCLRLLVSAGAMAAAGLLVLSGMAWPGALAAGLAAFALFAWLSGCVSPGELRQAWSSLEARGS